MAEKTQAAARKYPIRNEWLEKFKNNDEKYIDIEEIRNGTSGYITDIITGFSYQGNSFSVNTTVDDEMRKANFFPTGIIYGDDDQGEDVNGYLMDETPADKDVWTIAAKVVHPLRFKRIYPRWTEARKIKIVGYSKGNV